MYASSVEVGHDTTAGSVCGITASFNTLPHICARGDRHLNYSVILSLHIIDKHITVEPV